jgi:hypothetical protein
LVYFVVENIEERKRMTRNDLKIVSGGQTGVDRAGLAAAMSFGIATGGWMPKGRLAEDGVVPERFHTLKECPAGGGDLSAIDGKGDLV